MTCKRCGGTGQEIDYRFLRRRREVAGLSQGDVAGAMGITASYLSDLEHGRRDWDAARARKFKAVLQRRGYVYLEVPINKP